MIGVCFSKKRRKITIKCVHTQIHIILNIVCFITCILIISDLNPKHSEQI